MTAMIKLAVATGERGEFGLQGGLPWGKPLSADMKEFRKFTEDCTLLMGSATFESLPTKLPGRKHVVLSSREVQAKDGSKPDLILNEAITEMLLHSIVFLFDRCVCVIGGAGVVETCAPFAQEILHTYIKPLGIHAMNADVYVDTSKLYYHPTRQLEVISAGCEGDYHYCVSILRREN